MNYPNPIDILADPMKSIPGCGSKWQQISECGECRLPEPEQVDIT